jgi:hypothetical protein
MSLMAPVERASNAPACVTCLAQLTPIGPLLVCPTHKCSDTEQDETSRKRRLRIKFRRAN